MATTTVSKDQIGLIFQNKKGLLEFLTVEMEYFLPPRDFVNYDWLRDIWQGKKKVRLTLTIIPLLCY